MKLISAARLTPELVSYPSHCRVCTYMTCTRWIYSEVSTVSYQTVKALCPVVLSIVIYEHICQSGGQSEQRLHGWVTQTRGAGERAAGKSLELLKRGNGFPSAQIGKWLREWRRRSEGEARVRKYPNWCSCWSEPPCSPPVMCVWFNNSISHSHQIQETLWKEAGRKSLYSRFWVLLLGDFYSQH